MSPGDLVVCVNAGPLDGLLNIGLERLRVGDVYTVKLTDGNSRMRPGFRVALVEVDTLPPAIWWHSDRFRPCRKTDIGELEAMTKKREREAAE